MSPRLGGLTCYSCSSVIKIDTKTIFIYRHALFTTMDVKIKVKTKSDLIVNKQISPNYFA